MPRLPDTVEVNLAIRERGRGLLVGYLLGDAVARAGSARATASRLTVGTSSQLILASAEASVSHRIDEVLAGETHWPAANGFHGMRRWVLAQGRIPNRA